MKVREVAASLNVNEKSVCRLAQKRGMPGFKVAGAWLRDPLVWFLHWNPCAA
jgi:hypothetical protein